jgi:hypothetical protein
MNNSSNCCRKDSPEIQNENLFDGSPIEELKENVEDNEEKKLQLALYANVQP